METLCTKTPRNVVPIQDNLRWTLEIAAWQAWARFVYSGGVSGAHTHPLTDCSEALEFVTAVPLERKPGAGERIKVTVCFHLEKPDA